MYALISIHDVMPHTLKQVEHLLTLVPKLAIKNTVLLVVPGLNWTPEQLEKIKYWQALGYRLAGHGWKHKVNETKSIYHQLHAKFISRNVAEHLSLNENEINSLLNRCYSWFINNNFDPPDLYVPPAWALGKVSMTTLKSSPFRYFENSCGFIDSKTEKQLLLPLAGFEADTLFRQLALNLWNSSNKLLCSPKRPLRISIHPNDYQLKLAKQFISYLDLSDHMIDYRNLWKYKG